MGESMIIRDFIPLTWILIAILNTYFWTIQSVIIWLATLVIVGYHIELVEHIKEKSKEKVI